jgi:anaerobic magnesium-protoporphyrin IX monomethyl ester cyclase
MKVTFVYPDLQIGVPEWRGYYYCGVGSLAGQLKRAEHRTSLIHITQPEYGREHFLADIEAAAPDLVAFSATTLAFPWVVNCLRWLREAGIKTPTICGGAHPSVDAEHAIQAEGLDMICLGEGEGALLDLVDALESGRPHHQIENLWVKHDGEIHRNQLRGLVQDLDTLAPYDRDDWLNYPQLLHERDGEAIVIASRGCPFKCTYCVNHFYMELFPDKQYVRFRSPDNVIAELVSLVEKYPFIRGFHFDDDILYMRKSWSIEFTEKYKKALGLPFVCNMRPNICSREIVKLMKEANCHKVMVGLESGNEYIRNTLLLRALKAEDMVTAFHRFEEVGIETVSFNMVGLPDETPANVLETVKLNAVSHVTYPQVSIFYPFPGTKLAKYCEDKGYVRPFRGDVYDYFSDSNLDMPSMTRDDIVAYRLSFRPFMYAYRAVYRLPEPLRRPVEAALDRVYTSRYHGVLAMKVMQPARRLYREGVRLAFQKLRRYVRGQMQRQTPELGAAPVLAGHDV